jgi:hypothetical protein
MSFKRTDRTEYIYVDRPHITSFGKNPFALQNLLFSPAHVDEADQVVECFARSLRSLRERENISSLCFLQIEGRPAGALSILHRLVIEVKLPACVWARRDIQGYKPEPGERLALVHDTCVSGATLIEAGRSLQTRHHVETVAAVVFTSEQPPVLEDKDFKLHIIAIARPADMSTETPFAGSTSKGWAPIDPQGRGVDIAAHAATLPTPSQGPDPDPDPVREEGMKREQAEPESVDSPDDKPRSFWRTHATLLPAYVFFTIFIIVKMLPADLAANFYKFVTFSLP